MTDQELNKLFAVKVAGWKPTRGPNAKSAWFNFSLRGPGRTRFRNRLPDYVNSADAVLPWLEKCFLYEVQGGLIGQHYVGISSEQAHYSNDLAENTREFQATAPTFPRAAVLALLKAHGGELT